MEVSGISRKCETGEVRPRKRQRRQQGREEEEDSLGGSGKGGMGCDWSKASSAADDIPNAPYTLLSVSVEDNVSYQGTPQGKGRSRKRGAAPPSSR